MRMYIFRYTMTSLFWDPASLFLLKLPCPYCRSISVFHLVAMYVVGRTSQMHSSFSKVIRKSPWRVFRLFGTMYVCVAKIAGEFILLWLKFAAQIPLAYH